MEKILFKNARLVNEGKEWEGDLLVNGERIERIDTDISDKDARIVDCKGLILMPGVIDDQVHFREPGLTHKADIFTESRAAAAGGITSFMEMPNTIPQTLTQDLLEEKYLMGQKNSLVNYSFFMGVSNDNYEEVMKTPADMVCGLKMFLGSSTGNMLVDKEATLRKVFGGTEMLIATHCEKEEIVKANMAEYQARYGDDIPFECHPLIRSEEACYASSSAAHALATEYGTRLHILHISTEKETHLFGNDLPLAEKKITAEACVHHLWFDDTDYPEFKSRIKWNPAVKKASDRDGIWQALQDGRIDIIATDHAPHTAEEKSNPYASCPSGGPLVQHALPAILLSAPSRGFNYAWIVEKMCHNPAICFRMKDRGYLREGYFADLVLVDPGNPWKVTPDNILYKCGWSPFNGTTFDHQVSMTWVNGTLVYEKGKILESGAGKRLEFRLN